MYLPCASLHNLRTLYDCYLPMRIVLPLSTSRPFSDASLKRQHWFIDLTVDLSASKRISIRMNVAIAVDFPRNFQRFVPIIPMNVAIVVDFLPRSLQLFVPSRRNSCESYSSSRCHGSVKITHKQQKQKSKSKEDTERAQSECHGNTSFVQDRKYGGW